MILSCKMRDESSGVMSVIFKQTQYLEWRTVGKISFTASQLHSLTGKFKYFDSFQPYPKRAIDMLKIEART
jgi:hypothetical protein